MSKWAFVLNFQLLNMEIEVLLKALSDDYVGTRIEKKFCLYDDIVRLKDFKQKVLHQSKVT